MLVVEENKLLFAGLHHSFSLHFFQVGHCNYSLIGCHVLLFLHNLFHTFSTLQRILMELQELNAIVEAFLDRIIHNGKTFDAVLKGVKVEPIEKAGTLQCSLYVRKDLQNRMGNLHGGCTGWSITNTLSLISLFILLLFYSPLQRLHSFLFNTNPLPFIHIYRYYSRRHRNSCIINCGK